jgi:hypothetical protein
VFVYREQSNTAFWQDNIRVVFTQAFRTHTWAPGEETQVTTTWEQQACGENWTEEPGPQPPGQYVARLEWNGRWSNPVPFEIVAG